MAATENPAFAGGPVFEAAAGSSMGIKAGLRDGTLTSDEAIVLMEEQMEAREKQLRAEMDAKIAAAQLDAAEGGATLISAVRGVVARLTETPANFHQATVYFLTADAEDEAMARRAPLLYAGSLAMVGLQSATAVGVFWGTVLPACATSDQCGAGTWCGVGGGGRCNYCGSEVPLPLETEGACTDGGGEFTAADAACTTQNNAADPNHVGFNRTRVAEVCTLPYAERVGLSGFGHALTFSDTSVASWCETCVRNDGTVDPLTGYSLATGNLATMGPFDHVALAFAAFIVAFTVVGELKDIELCSMAVAHAGERLSKGWRLALGFLLGMRRWVFLPILVMTVPILVLLKGGDALSICFNTVAILFLCDIDNIAFDLALGERVRARVEDAGRVELEDVEASALVRTKAVHVAMIVLAVLGGVRSGGNEEASSLPWLAFLLGGVAEALVLGASAVETAKRVGKVAGAWLLGFLFFLLLTLLLN
eukprot:COSAG02_NODE_753_length_17610_cov_23.119753_17_plen_480_part_00